MEVVSKNNSLNGKVPLPQRQKIQGGGGNKNPNVQQKKEDGGPPDKKPRFSQPGGSPQSQNQNGGSLQNQNRGGGNRNRGGGGRGGNQNRGNLTNQRQNDIKQQNDGGDGGNKDKASVGGVDPVHQQKQQQPQQHKPNQQQHQHPSSQQQNRENQQQHHQSQQQHRENQQQHNQSQQQHHQQNQHQQNANQNVGKRDRSRGGRGGRGSMGGGGGDGNDRNDRNYRNDDFFIGQRLRAIGGPTHELPPIENTGESKFSGRNRLYIGNLTNDITEEGLREMFKPYGEIGEVFCNAEKNFTFLKMDYHSNAEKAKRELDGTMRKGRALRIRFAPNATILRVKNLTPFVSNELLYKSFEAFGPVERATIVVDDRGKHTGEGIVEFEKKSSANACIRLCNEKCFFLTASLRPCVVEPFEINDDADGLPDKSLNKKTSDFNHERNVGPRFAENGSFEHEYGTRWKQLHELYKTKQDALKRELRMEEEKLEAQMEYARYEHETEMLRQELRKRESDNERKKMEWELREKQAEDMRMRDEESMRRQQSEMQSRMLRQEEEMRRRQQENTLFMQAQQLNSLLDQQEGGGFGGGGGNSGNFGHDNSPFDIRGNNAGAGGGMNNNGPNNQQEPFAFEFGGNNQNQGGGGGSGLNNQRGGINASNNNNNNNNNPWERRRRY